MKGTKKTKIIKKYQNRKLYDTEQSCYVTLDDIAKMVRQSEDIIVIDNKTKENVTALTLTQIIFKSKSYAPVETLREIIQHGDGSITDYFIKLGVVSPRAKEGLKQEVRQDVSKEPSIEEKVAHAAKKPKDASEELPNSFELPSGQENLHFNNK